MVRGQYAGYREELNVAKNSDVETFCALRLFIDSWRWAGVPWYLRSGKRLAETRTRNPGPVEAASQDLFADSGRRPAAPTIFVSGFRPVPQSPSPPASSGRGRSSSAISGNSTWSKSSPERNRPTSGYWATPWLATERSSHGRTRLRPLGRWSSRFSRPTTRPAPIGPAAGGRERRTSSSKRTAAGTAPAADGDGRN